jgi:hypothetical protein
VGVDNGHLLLLRRLLLPPSIICVHRRTLSFFSLSLSLSFVSPSLSLCTDNNNFTKDKVLAKQQRAKQNPKKKKRDRDF